MLLQGRVHRAPGGLFLSGWNSCDVFGTKCYCPSAVLIVSAEMACAQLGKEAPGESPPGFKGSDLSWSRFYAEGSETGLRQ